MLNTRFRIAVTSGERGENGTERINEAKSFLKQVDVYYIIPYTYL